MGYWAERVRRGARRLLAGPDPAILMYHRVAEPQADPWGLAVSPANFAAQMRALRRLRQPVSLDEMAQRLANGTLERRMVAVTFDDAYRDVLTNAKPILAEYGIPATVFVVTDRLGDERGFWWDRLAAAVMGGELPERLPPFSFLGGTEWKAADQARELEDRDALHLRLWEVIRLLPPEAREAAADAVCSAFGGGVADPAPIMTEAELGALTAGGLIRIGAHTMTHPSLPSLSAGDQRAEIMASKHRLEAITGEPICRLAYPFGDYDERSIAIAQDLGFDYAVSVEAGPVGDPAARFRLPRHDIKNWSGEEFGHRLRWRI